MLMSLNRRDHSYCRIDQLHGRRIIAGVVKQRMDALILATEARHDWLKKIGVQPPLNLA